MFIIGLVNSILMDRFYVIFILVLILFRIAMSIWLASKLAMFG